MNKSQLKQLIKEVLGELSSSSNSGINVGDRIHVELSGNVVETAASQVKVRFDSLGKDLWVDETSVKKLEF